MGHFQGAAPQVLGHSCWCTAGQRTARMALRMMMRECEAHGIFPSGSEGGMEGGRGEAA